MFTRSQLSAFSTRPRRSRRPRVDARRAFTLLELLVAAVITAVLAGFIVVIVSNVSGFWTRTAGKLSTEAQARLVLDQLTQDLSSAHYRDDGSFDPRNPGPLPRTEGNIWMGVDVLNGATGELSRIDPDTLSTHSSRLWQPAAANPKPTNNLSLSMTAAKIADARFGHAGVWLRFFTTKRGSNVVSSTGVTDLTTVSAPIAVGYRIIRRFSAPSALNQRTSYVLHRAETRPVLVGGRPGVLDSGYNITAAAYTTSTAGNNNGATTGDPSSIQVPGSRTNFSSVIADNVIDFGVRCYVRDPTQASGLRLVFPAANETGAASNAANARLRAVLPANTVTDSKSYNLVMPEVVDVMVRILTDEGARLIGTFEQANSPLTLPAGVNAQQYWWQLANAHSQVFTRRIVLPTKPL